MDHYRHPDARLARRRVFGRSVVTGLLIVASLIWGITGA